MIDSSSDRDPVESLAEEFVERTRAGEQPSIEEYALRYPALAEEIRDLFPTLAMMEQYKPSVDSTDGSASGRTSIGDIQIEQLGDFRILREIGRGGMGIVYEADQVSLGRHVALKVLPRPLLVDPKCRKRFEREARSAARLHHTNIVPVFGVGEQDGLHYYVMQFIQGHGLDEVLEELKRISREDPDASDLDRPLSGQTARRDFSAADAARSLVTGCFDMQLADEPTDEDGVVATQSVHRDVGATDSPPGADTGHQPDVRRTTAARTPLTSSSNAMVDLCDRSHAAGAGKRTFWHSIARIGIQVADALQYAHDHETLHRDVKPSNLLLDTSGTVWVTDFGLAKAADQQELTDTGDVLGTLRYMAPEAFQGKADARSDIYALGLTLYELLALRPAFDATDRHQLIRQLTQESPPNLDQLRPGIPRDLVTIVNKATDRDAAHRYGSAREFADDLKRFVADEPVLARRISSVERLRRWINKNRLLAASLGTIAVLMSLVTVGALLAAWGFSTRQHRLARELYRLSRHHQLTKIFVSETPTPAS